MTNAKRDENSVPTMIAALNTDGVTITRVYINASNHGLQVDDGVGGADHGTVNALKDENGVSCLMGVSSVDGVTPVPLYVTSAGKLLIKST